MDIQSVGVAAYNSQLGTAGGATQGASTPLGESTLEQPVDRSLDQDRGEAGADQSATEETPIGGYTADGQRSASASGSISILA